MIHSPNKSQNVERLGLKQTAQSEVQTVQFVQVRAEQCSDAEHCSALT